MPSVPRRLKPSSVLKASEKSPMAAAFGLAAIALRLEAERVSSGVGLVIERKGGDGDEVKVVVAKLHTAGSAYRSGMVDKHDIIESIDGRQVGGDVMLAAKLIKGVEGTTVNLALKKAATGSLATVELRRITVPNHVTNEAPISILGL